MVSAYEYAVDRGADLVLFPELAICGYPPEDLLLKPGFVERSQAAVHDLAARIDGPAPAVVGWVDGERLRGAEQYDHPDGPFNAAAVLHGGRVVSSYHKQVLPNYGVFDEKRYFTPGLPDQPLIDVGGVLVGITICEEMWVDDGPVLDAARAGAELIVNINASPFHVGKQAERRDLLRRRTAEVSVPIVYTNLVGGQDELVFDGGSLVLNSLGDVVAEAPRFESTVMLVDVEVASGPATGRPALDAAAVVIDVTANDERATLGTPAGQAEELSEEAEVWAALVLGVRDYIDKNGFGEVVIGLSGGVDSSIVAAIAVDALGPDRVHGVLMPSRYSSDHSISDAVALADALGIEHRTVPIEGPYAAFLDALEPSFEGHDADLTEENLQSRIRGVLLMALSNKFGWLVLTTGNKSESAVGYSTLYGDTAGALAVIKDVPKLLVYRLCRWRNELAGTPLVPESVLTKAPSAELRPDQTDQQSLPPYEDLDPIIEGYVDGEMTIDELVAAGHEAATVERIVGLIDRAEYKRRQSPPGLRISQKAFGRDRRLPITSRSSS